MIKTVAQTKVSGIFSVDNRKVYQIPKYQREYTWAKAEWEALYNDVTENEQGYFLGSYICVNKESLQDITMEVIDGQQRFTTIVILLATLYKRLSAYSDLMDEDDKTDLANLRSQIAIKERKESGNGRRTIFRQKLIPQRQNQNDEDFAYMLFDTGVITGPIERPKNYGYRRISKANMHFDKLIDDDVKRRMEENPGISEVTILFDIEDKFNAAILVGIEVDTNRDAFMLFESLNHRGVPLSSLDLIKNTLISKAENDGDTDRAYEKWKQTLQNIDSDNYAVQERFFRQYYNAFRGELNEPVKDGKKEYAFGYMATRTTLIDIYENLIKYDYRKLLDELYEKSKLYAIIVNNCDIEKVYSDSLKELERIAGAPSYILLLYLLAKQEDMCLTDDDINDIVQLLVTFFVRRNITDIPGTRKLIQMFMNIVTSVRDRMSVEVICCIRRILRHESAPDSIFEEKIRGPVYDENPDATRYILCAIERTHQTKEIYTDLWKRDSGNKYIWTIEHIFPEGERIPKAWINMIAGGDAELARQYRMDYVHTLGNLTITGFNSNLSNFSFEEKKDRRSKDKSKSIGYRNGLFLNSDVVNENEWTVETIKNRTDRLVSIVMDMYKWGDDVFFDDNKGEQNDDVMDTVKQGMETIEDISHETRKEKKPSDEKIHLTDNYEEKSIEELKEEYKRLFRKRFGMQKYIWKAPDTFNKIWNPNGNPLPMMIENATRDAEIILEADLFHPRKILVELAMHNSDAVRDSLNMLFDEERDLQERCEQFSGILYGLGKTYNINKGETYQGYNAMSTYLWLRYPSKYYFYKYSVNAEVARRFGIQTAGLRETEYSKMIKGFQLFDSVREFLAKDEELMHIVDETLSDDCFRDDDYHCLATDFCFFLRPLYGKRKDKSRVDV